MTRVLPYPLLSLSLLALWLLLNQSLGPGHLLLGAVLAIGGGLALTALEPPRTRIRRPHLIVSLAVVVLRDIIRSNIAVTRIILKPKRGGITSGFVGIPLDMRSPAGLTMLAIIITSTPGTLWIGFDPGSGLLTIHVLDLIDEAAWVEIIKQRYERRLMEIFV